MTRPPTAVAAAVTATLGFAAVQAHADIAVTFDFDTWAASAGGPGALTYVDFGTVALGAVLTEQFAPLGLHFVDGDDWRVNYQNGIGQPLYPGFMSHVGFPQPGSQFDAILDFDSEQHAWGYLSVLSSIHIEFFLNGASVGEYSGATPNDGFVGTASNTAFDRVVLYGLSGSGLTGTGNQWFSTVPAPGGLFLLVLGAARRRRPSSGIST